MTERKGNSRIFLIGFFLLLCLFFINANTKQPFVEDFTDNKEKENNPSKTEETAPEEIKQAPKEIEQAPKAIEQAPKAIEQAPKAIEQAPPKAMKLIGYDDNKVYSSPLAPNFGKLIELKNVAVLNDDWSEKDVAEHIRKIKEPQPSQMGSFDSHFEVLKTMDGKPGPKPEVHQGEAPKMEVGDGPIEIHMVYADWCGHSKRALPTFDKLVKNTDVKTKSGRVVVFKKTDEKSPDFKKFKVRGFPSYMVNDGGNVSPINVGDRSEKSIIDAATALP